MTVSSSQVTVGTTATALYTDAGQFGGASVTVKNTGDESVFLGGGGVTTGNGYELASGEVLPIDLGRGETLYGIVAADTEPVAVLVTKE